MSQDWIEKLGAPDIALSGLNLWVHSYQFPEQQDFWDGNWLNATVRCSATGATVCVSGSFIRVPEIEQWAIEAKLLADALKREASLDCMEPELSVSLKAKSLGHIEMEVKISPDPLTQKHEFTFEIDQSYLPKLISQCAQLIQRFPIKGRNG